MFRRFVRPHCKNLKTLCMFLIMLQCSKIGVASSWCHQIRHVCGNLQPYKGYRLRILIGKAKVTVYENLHWLVLSIFSIFTSAKIDALRIFTDFHFLNSSKIWLNYELKFFSWKVCQLFLRFFRSGQFFLENLPIFKGEFAGFTVKYVLQ